VGGCWRTGGCQEGNFGHCAGTKTSPPASSLSKNFQTFVFCMGPQEQTSFSSSVSAFSLHGGTCISGVLILFCLDPLFHFNLFLYDFVLERRKLW